MSRNKGVENTHIYWRFGGRISKKIVPHWQQHPNAAHRSSQQQSDEDGSEQPCGKYGLCAASTELHICIRLPTSDEGDGADSVGATSAAANEGSDGDEGRCWGDGGRLWRWPTVGAVGG